MASAVALSSTSTIVTPKIDGAHEVDCVMLSDPTLPMKVQLEGSRTLKVQLSSALTASGDDPLEDDTDDHFASAGDESVQRQAPSTPASPVPYFAFQAIAELTKEYTGRPNHISTQIAKCHQRVEQVNADNNNLREVLAGLQNQYKFMYYYCYYYYYFAAFIHDSRAQPNSSVAHRMYQSQPAKSAMTSQRSPLRKEPTLPVARETGTSPVARETGYIGAPPQMHLRTSGATLPEAAPQALLAPERPDANAPCNFTVTFRKDKTGLGVILSRTDNDQALRVDEIVTSSVVECWNREAVPKRRILVGDTITSVNGVTNDAEAMFTEWVAKFCLNLNIVRGAVNAQTMTPQSA